MESTVVDKRISVNSLRKDTVSDITVGRSARVSVFVGLRSRKAKWNSYYIYWRRTSGH